jgi:hypothetical protein
VFNPYYRFNLFRFVSKLSSLVRPRRGTVRSKIKAAAEIYTDRAFYLGTLESRPEILNGWWIRVCACRFRKKAIQDEPLPYHLNFGFLLEAGHKFTHREPLSQRTRYGYLALNAACRMTLQWLGRGHKAKSCRLDQSLSAETQLYGP